MIQEKRKIVSISMEVLLKNNENVRWNTKHNLVRIMFRSHEACANIKGIFFLTKRLVLQITLIIKFVFGTRVITKGCFFCKWDCNFVGGSGRYLHLVFCCQTWSYLKIVLFEDTSFCQFNDMVSTKCIYVSYILRNFEFSAYKILFLHLGFVV